MKTKTKQSEKIKAFVWLMLGIVMLSGLASAGTLINESGMFVDNTKVSLNSYSTGFDNSTNFPIDQASSTSIFDQIQAGINALNNSPSGGKLLIKQGQYNVLNGASTFLDLSNVFGKGIWIQGEGFGTKLIKNNTNSAFMALGNLDAKLANGVILSDFQLIRGNQSLRLLNGQPSTLKHKNIFIERVLSEDNQGTSARWIDVNADNFHINEVTLQGQLRGGSGNQFFASQNYVQGNQSITGSEVECLDINGGNESYVYANSLHDCSEQIIDVNNLWSHIFGNHLEVNTPTDQGGVTLAADYGTLFGNTVQDAQNSRGGIEYHESSNFGTIFGNIVVSNVTNLTDGTTPVDKFNSEARGMRVDGENGTFIGNVFLGYNGTTIFQGATGQDNQFIGNWFEPTAELLEAHWGINLLGTVKQWVIQGANVNVTRNLTVTDTLSPRRFNLQMNTTTASCSTGTEGNLYYDGSTKKHYGCNSTAWNALY